MLIKSSIASGLVQATHNPGHRRQGTCESKQKREGHDRSEREGQVKSGRLTRACVP
ncbi:MAG: hypothetical protein RLZZ216_1860 [Cyanobacteriota bacterium]|jgi:hypothetical protein